MSFLREHCSNSFSILSSSDQQTLKEKALHTREKEHLSSVDKKEEMRKRSSGRSISELGTRRMRRYGKITTSLIPIYVHDQLTTKI